MYFLIDYENVTGLGMRGTEYLLPGDHVIVFYSGSVPNMEARHLQNIKDANCGFTVYKLLKAHKNALDFYIATKAGEIFGAGYEGIIIIVSKDAGFHAVRDFWATHSKPSRRVVLGESIEKSILLAGEKHPRTEKLQRLLKNADIGNFYSAYQETQKLKGILQEAFAGTQYIERTGEMEEILKQGSSPKVIYLDTLRRFGRKDGLVVYNTLKNCLGTPPKNPSKKTS